MHDTHVPVHQHTCGVTGLAPFHLAGFLHILEVPLCRFNVSDLAKEQSSSNTLTTDLCVCIL